MESQKEEVFKFISEQNLPEGKKIVASNAIWCFASNLSTVFVSSGSFSGEYSLRDFHLNPSTDIIKGAGFIEYFKKIFIFCHRNKSPTLLLLYLDESSPSPKTKKYSTILLSSLYFHNLVYNVFSPFQNSFCVISREGISIHSIDDLSVLYEKYWITNMILNCCFHNDILAICDQKLLSIFQFSSKDKCERIAKIKPNSPDIILKRIFSCNNSVYLISINSSQKILIKLISFQPNEKSFSVTEKNIDSLYPYSDLSYDQISFSLFDQTLLISSPKATSLIDFQGTKSVLLGQISGKPDSQIVNDSYFVSISNNILYEFQENYQSFQDPCPLDIIGAIIRRKNGLQTAFEKLIISLQKSEKVTSSMIENIVKKIGAYATSPMAQIRFTRAIMYSGITNPHLILLGLLRYSNILQSKLVLEARRPLLDILSKDEIANAVPSLLSSWNQKLDKNSMEILLNANPIFYELDSSYFQNTSDFIRACIESDRGEKAMTLILMEATSGNKNEELASVIELYIQKYGDNIQRSYKKLLNYMTS
ncbi:hypothetical protein M9Y10_038974 [Tritrichomonas musculus]|uniref:Mic1 domain-containing protein n=1 Tax=Tritrichomonas musculus TaxID=1915356 RepID=A0ABR2KD29_9EUKA